MKSTQINLKSFLCNLIMGIGHLMARGKTARFMEYTLIVK